MKQEPKKTMKEIAEMFSLPLIKIKNIEANNYEYSPEEFEKFLEDWGSITGMNKDDLIRYNKK